MMNAGPHAIPAPHPENYAETFNAVPNRKYDCIENSCFSHSRCPHHQFHASYASETLIFPILDARIINFTLPMHRILLFFLFPMPVAINFTLPMHRILLFFSFSMPVATNFMLPMHRILLFFLFPMPAPPISCFLCIGNSYFSYSRCPHHQFHASYASDSLVFPIPDARSHQFHASYASDSLVFLILDARSHQFHASYASDSLVFPIPDARSHKTCLTLTAYRLSSPSYIDLIGMSTAITSVPTISAINTMISGSIAARTLWVVISTSSS